MHYRVVDFEAVVIGAGHAGLAASYYLKQQGLSHVVYERGRIGESWRSQRWNSFCLNTPNSFSHLPGDEYAGDHREAFYHRDEFVATLERYVERFGLPVETDVEVTHVAPTSGHFRVSVRRRSDGPEEIEARNVIVASGIQNVPRIPSISADIPDSIVQIHSAEYLSPRELPDGGVLVVGGGQSGLQIAEDLLEAGRKVCLSSSKVARARRRYRGRDILEWMRDVGITRQRTIDLEDRSVIYETVPQVSGVGPLGRTVSYQALARDGAMIVGRLAGFEDGCFLFDGDAADNVRFADQKSHEIKTAIDQFLKATGQPILPLENDPNDEPDPEASCASALRSLNAAEEGFRSVVWCTGFRGSFDWIDAPVVGDDGRPSHVDGVSHIPGLYFLGFPWLRTRNSGIINGITEDAAWVVSRLETRP